MAKKNDLARAVKADKKLQRASVALHKAAIAFGEAETALKAAGRNVSRKHTL